MASPAVTAHGTRRFTSDEVWRMAASGLLESRDRFELLDGELVYVSPQDPPHAIAIARLCQVLTFAYGPAFLVRPQLPIGGIADSIPEPDLAVVPAATGPAPTHPTAAETVLLVEVCDTSRARDQQKAAIYATAGAAEYWIVDVACQTIDVHRGPLTDGGWRSVERRDAHVSIPLPGLEVDISLRQVLGGPSD